MKARIFTDRKEAGKVLSQSLAHYAGKSDTIILALPRGGVPVAHEIAKALSLPMDIWLVRKLGVPGHEEMAMGAIASNNVQVVNEELVTMLGIEKPVLDAVIASEQAELKRRSKLYRGDRPPPGVAGKTAIVVDDGLATGATMLAAVASLRKSGARRVVSAVPVCSDAACLELSKTADEIVCPHRPEPFYGVGMWYDDFSQTTDAEVQEILAQSATGKTNAFKPDPLLSQLEKHVVPLSENATETFLQAARGKKYVLIGEATHGTEEFYRIRAELTMKLIEEEGFDAVAVEADWPDAHRVHRYACGIGDDDSGHEALSDFERFPVWMWRNKEVLRFVEWLRGYNYRKTPERLPVGFFGLDLYSMTASAEAVISYLDKVDPSAAAAARERYQCLNYAKVSPQAYGYASEAGISKPCEEEALSQLMALRRKSAEYMKRDGYLAQDEYFSAQQNASLVRDAEQYYRALFRGYPNTWNLRDQHMFDTLKDISAHLGSRLNRAARIVVWAHNSHIGNAAATEMSLRGEFNIGQLVREVHGNQCLLLGFSTSSGTVTAASEWDGPADITAIRPPLADSYEDIFSRLSHKQFLIDLRKAGSTGLLKERRLQRAIGVVYSPATERQSHYFYSSLPQQFDFLIHIDQTTALEPLTRVMRQRSGELEETYPFGL